MHRENATSKISLTEGFTLRDDGTGISHFVYTLGTGMAVILMHEITGMTKPFLALANRIAENGFRVYLPHFFGQVDHRDVSAGVLFCLRNEFNVWCSHGDSRIASWLRTLCAKADREGGGHGVGVIGLCLTGNIVLSAMVLDCVRAGVMCEPALPFIHKSALGVPQCDVDRARERARIFPMRAYRFSTDRKCTHSKFQTLSQTFGSGIDLTEIPTGTAPWHIPNGRHSVLTDDRIPHVDDPNHPVQHAIDEILGTLRQRLRSDSVSRIHDPTSKR